MRKIALAFIVFMGLSISSVSAQEMPCITSFQNWHELQPADSKDQVKDITEVVVFTTKQEIHDFLAEVLLATQGEDQATNDIVADSELFDKVEAHLVMVRPTDSNEYRPGAIITLYKKLPPSTDACLTGVIVTQPIMLREVLYQLKKKTI